MYLRFGILVFISLRSSAPLLRVSAPHARWRSLPDPLPRAPTLRMTAARRDIIPNLHRTTALSFPTPSLRPLPRIVTPEELIRAPRLGADVAGLSALAPTNPSLHTRQLPTPFQRRDAMVGGPIRLPRGLYRSVRVFPRPAVRDATGEDRTLPRAFSAPPQPPQPLAPTPDTFRSHSTRFRARTGRSLIPNTHRDFGGILLQSVGCSD